MRRATALGALCCTRCAAAALLALTPDNLTAAVLNSPPLLVAFCTAWSPHCSLLLPELAAAADTLAAQGAAVSLGSCDGGYDQDFPVATMRWFDGRGDGVEYGGSRTAASIVRWVQTQLAADEAKDEL